MNGFAQVLAGEKINKKYVLIWLSRAPTQKRDRLLLYNFGYIFPVITLKTLKYYWLRPILTGGKP